MPVLVFKNFEINMPEDFRVDYYSVRTAGLMITKHLPCGSPCKGFFCDKCGISASYKDYKRFNSFLRMWKL